MFKNNFFSVAIIIFALFLTLFNSWEPGTESQIYWLFSKIISDTGQFNIFGRSPIYSLYLLGFSWMSFPYSTIVEYLFTSGFILFSIFYFFEKFEGKKVALLITILWIPFLQVLQPPVVKIGLALSLLGINARINKKGNSPIVQSYAFFLFASLFRTNFLLIPIIFLVIDIYTFLKNWGIRPKLFKPKLIYWPIYIFFLLIIIFSSFQSNHKWNNVWGVNTDWFPGDGKSVFDVALLQNQNVHYVKEKYGSFRDQDIYSTNKELFNGATDAGSAFHENPRFIFRQIYRNILPLVLTTGHLTIIPRVYNHLFLNPETYLKTLNKNSHDFLPQIYIALSIIAFLVILYASFRYSYEHDGGVGVLSLFIFSLLAIYGSGAIFELPQVRRLFPLIPVFTFGAIWIGRSIGDNFNDNQLLKNNLVIISISLIVFTSGITDWRIMLKNIYSNMKDSKINILQERPFSPSASYEVINSLIKDCDGVMAYEHKFIASFMDIPLEKVYDIFEIPPFGQYGDGNYVGLKPDRIDCILVSKTLKSPVTGNVTNWEIRYKNYIKPYIQELKNMGAQWYKIPNYGEAFVLY